MSNALDVVRFPLFGSRLIEASAGTGKTYTISGLVLRLLLGHGGENAYHRPLKIEEILVVTFTEAATAELRSRIRDKIHKARIAFLRSQEHIFKSDDLLINALIESSGDRLADAQCLLIAEQNMDQASVFTIHGFCQRMLKQHAFESGMPFESEFISSEAQLRLQAAEDIWRENFYQSDLAMVARVMKLWSEGPMQLLGQLRSLFSQTQIQLQGQPLDQDFEAWFNSRCQAIGRFKHLWIEHAQEIETLLGKAQLNGRVYKKNTLPKWLAELQSFAANTQDSDELNKNVYRFSQAELISQTKDGCEPPLHAVFSLIDELLIDTTRLKDAIVASLYPQIKARYQALKQQQQSLSFDDLLSFLALTLKGESAERLATGIRELYPVAMIDEFQDTDAQQYFIFNRLYGQQQDLGMFLIGDPKQAIYGFRGADIFTYMQARQELSDHYTLPVNWRSSAAMVDASNAVFNWHTHPFIFKDAIDFEPVSAAEKNQDIAGICIDGIEQKALQLIEAQGDNAVMSNNAYKLAQARDCALRIQGLLQAGDEGRGTIGPKQKPIGASSIAVLVRTRKEGELVAQQLAKQNIASVSLSNRDSVFSCPEAMAWYLQMQAVLNPNNERLMRAALAAPVLGYDFAVLDALTQDENLWQQQVDEYHEHQRVWQRHGVLAMFYQWLAQRKLGEKLLSQMGGDRVLTNLLQLAEILQQQSAKLESEAALQRWFAQQLLEPDGDASEQQLRLESDANLVQIVTIHKSKGLEYDIVFLPFAFSFMPARECIYHIEEQLVFDLNGDELAKEAAEKERLAEDLRLLYVALTRAVYCCFIGIAAIGKVNKSSNSYSSQKSALGYLLQRNQSGDKTFLQQEVQAFLQTTQHASLESCIDDERPIYAPIQSAADQLEAKPFRSSIDNNWWISSYSALSRSRHDRHNFDASFEVQGLDLALQQDSLEQDLDVLDVFHFPRGSEAGSFLHLVFEELDFQLAAPEVEAQLALLLVDHGYDSKWLPALIQLRTQVLQTPLLDNGRYCLADIQAGQRLNEMEFVLPMANLKSSEMNRLLRHFDALSAKARGLDFQQIKGMLKGFIDLVYQHEGRYYVLDYKSNHLGYVDSDYNNQAMETAMIEHRYDFQYQLYALALHRFLAQRVVDYDFEQHFGGVYYLFMRGMPGATLHSPAHGQQHQGVYFARPDASFIQALDRAFQDGSHSFSEDAQPC
ncbi:exodeoxyribonuclease V subunit beta [Alginatibacterium sediminis]|uniref:RecBCD enzyme subunit RecB n=1 Tax=Alginatibacterium sediminis TaxID=2164068 RepID=A0A420ELC9_9ALTE|nr:exodeoxyribonuclease V subunit beta [Alginatibacterium sediminis]RKF21517.1 exodeoxyribonuclease V subunit beta [Alginatibacterium sediminis]